MDKKKGMTQTQIGVIMMASLLGVAVVCAVMSGVMVLVHGVVF